MQYFNTSPIPRVLIIAGSDCSGGAGIQADIKTVTMLGGYAMTAITALTAQNTLGVHGILDIPTELIAQQMTLCLEDIGADILKTGMLHRADVIHTIADVYERHAMAVPLVVDPVMVAKGGASLLENAAARALKERLIPLATLITPNIPEAEVLLGHPITSLNEMKQAAEELLQLGSKAVLLKGGHLEGETVADVLLAADLYEVFESPRIHSVHTHGTGCTLASGVATLCISRGTLAEAVREARLYVRRAIEHAPRFGQGHGPLYHAHPLV